MSGHREARPPAVCLWLIHLAGWIAPPRARAAWRARWGRDLRSFCTLAARGELAADPSARLTWFCRCALASAFWLRFDREAVRRWIRGPWFVPAAGLAALAVLACLTHGFAVTRSLVEAARNWQRIPLATGVFDPRRDKLVKYAVPILLALATGVTVAANARLSMQRHGWRYWSYLAAKLGLVTLAASLAWMEGGARLRGHLHSAFLHDIAGGLGLGLVFIVAYSWGVIWSLSDQRNRCPVCLERLGFPVTFGSWASVFEPAATELLCVEGHGSLSVAEGRSGQGDWWRESVHE